MGEVGNEVKEPEAKGDFLVDEITKPHNERIETHINGREHRAKLNVGEIPGDGGKCGAEVPVYVPDNDERRDAKTKPECSAIHDGNRD